MADVWSATEPSGKPLRYILQDPMSEAEIVDRDLVDLIEDPVLWAAAKAEVDGRWSKRRDPNNQRAPK